LQDQPPQLFLRFCGKGLIPKYLPSEELDTLQESQTSASQLPVEDKLGASHQEISHYAKPGNIIVIEAESMYCIPVAFCLPRD
jgi:hypothetical protein